MRRGIKRICKAVCVAALLLCGCTSVTADSQKDIKEEQKPIASHDVLSREESIFQVALLQSLMSGDYHGSISVGELKTMGDTGLGTFHGMNGEMIVLDGVVYQALGDGRVIIPEDTVMVPFSDVTVFNADESVETDCEMTLKELQERLDEIIAETGRNLFYMVKMEAEFPYMKVRSVYEQTEPYKPLTEVIKTDQVVFDYENVKGTVVALYCPDYVDGLNMTGWHYHFISEDRSKGGHILDFTVSAGGRAELDSTAGFTMLLPESGSFQQLNLSADLKEAIESVEKN